MKTKLSKDNPYKLYTDGGVIGKNPSPYGGTWACVLTFNDRKLWEYSGYITPDQVDFPKNVVTNNQTELFAVLEGLSYLLHNHVVQICSDSNVTLGRVFRGSSFNNIPDWMISCLDVQIKRLIHWKKFSYQLMNGHPTQKELEAGIGKRGYPVSKWNVLCDKLCQEQAEEYRKTHEYC